MTDGSNVVRGRVEHARMGSTSAGAVTLRLLDDRFPAGTTVNAYPRGAKPPVAQPPGPPGAASLASATVAADGSAALTGLPDRQYLTAYALVGGRYNYVDFSTYPIGARG
jgi:hypothetical protein